MINEENVKAILESMTDSTDENFIGWYGPETYKGKKDGVIYLVYEASYKAPFYSESPLLINTDTGEYKLTNHLDLIDGYDFIKEA